MAEAVSQAGSKKVDGSQSASGHGTQVLLGAIHVGAGEVCERNSVHVRAELGDQVLGRHDVDGATR